MFQESDESLNNRAEQMKKEIIENIGVKSEPIDSIFNSLRDFCVSQMEINNRMVSDIGNLERENDDLQFIIASLRADLHNQEKLFCGLTSNRIALKLWKEKEKEIKGIEKDRDSFAVRFARYCERNLKNPKGYDELLVEFTKLKL